MKTNTILLFITIAIILAIAIFYHPPSFESTSRQAYRRGYESGAIAVQKLMHAHNFSRQTMDSAWRADSASFDYELLQTLQTHK